MWSSGRVISMIVHSGTSSLGLGKTQETALKNIGGMAGILLHSIRIFCFGVQILPQPFFFLFFCLLDF